VLFFLVQPVLPRTNLLDPLDLPSFFPSNWIPGTMLSSDNVEGSSSPQNFPAFTSFKTTVKPFPHRSSLTALALVSGGPSLPLIDVDLSTRISYAFSNSCGRSMDPGKGLPDDKVEMFSGAFFTGSYFF